MSEGANLETRAPDVQERTSGFAIASLVLGILGFVLIPLVGSILAVIFGHIARERIKNDPALKGRGLALAGLILGWIEIAFLGLAFIFLVVATAVSSG